MQSDSGSTNALLPTCRRRPELVRGTEGTGAGSVIDGHADTVQILLDVGADVNAQTTDGSTALQMAEDQDHADVIEALVAAGVERGP